MNIRDTARRALDDIRTKARGHVYASRKGIVGGSAEPIGTVTVFRREGRKVRMEIWPKTGESNRAPEVFELPTDLEREAGGMLDSL